MKKKLWTVLGPAVCAGCLAFGLLLFPLNFGPLSQTTIRNAAVSMSTNVFLGTRIKNQAIDQGYVPFVGSSELSRMDPFHPSVLARKYQRNYQPLLIGNAGTQSLTHFVNLQSSLKQLRGKKLVMIISPQWFTAQGQRPDAFGYYYSPLEVSTWLLQAKNTIADRYAARRLLRMPATHSNTLIHNALLRIAAGQSLGQYRTWLNTQRRVLQNEDNLFSRFNLTNNNRRIVQAEKWLPDNGSLKELNVIAGRIAARHTTSNHFGIDNQFFNQRLSRGRMDHLRGKQRHFDYRQSPEYSDLELLLTNFAKYDINVQFIIPPVNARWAKYTKLSLPMYTQTVTKIKRQLTSQGFNHVLDLSRDGNRRYFMQDTIHLGWRGWVAVDCAVRPFMAKQQSTPHYHLNSQYFTKHWQLTE